MTMSFREALLARIDGPGKPSLKSVAEAAHVSYEQLKKVRQGKSQSTNAEDAIKIAAHFGLTLNEFLQDDLAEDRAIVVATYKSLSEAERQLLRDAAAGRSSRDQSATD